VTLVGISILSFSGFFDFTIVDTVLPSIQAELDASVGGARTPNNAPRRNVLVRH